MDLHCTLDEFPGSEVECHKTRDGVFASASYYGTRHTVRGDSVERCILALSDWMRWFLYSGMGAR